jgi:hypothetical protein
MPEFLDRVAVGTGVDVRRLQASDNFSGASPAARMPLKSNNFGLH